ncbi:CDP-alcohol phosphatidyltransferase family protein [Microbacterium sp. DT81.1]|uniref:CDP-alcohol phosphatidyltransferase family protein n=1 Tax=Microbacterium sp. DT81.1 TaxID=3393413 RepID=UPI003CEE4C10
MSKVHLAPLSSIGVGAVGLFAVDRVSALSVAGWTAGLLYLVVSNALLTRGLNRRTTIPFGWANGVTALRSTMVGVVTGLVATSFTASVSVPLLVWLAGIALALDAVDGWIARITNTVSELGARFDMEVDAFFLLVLSAYLAPSMGWWVLTIGLLRYVFVAAGWLLPWMRRTLPHRYWRKVVTAVAGIALVLAASTLAPAWAGLAGVLVALALLLESFGRDTVWLIRRRGSASSAEEGAKTAAGTGREA